MNYLIKLGAIIFMLIFSHFVIASELDDAIVYGNLLTEAVKEKASVKLKKLPEYKEIKEYLSKNKCPGFKYKGYVVGPEKKQYFYLIASQGKSVIIGRHFKVPINNGVIEVAQFESSTNGCLNLGSPPSNAVSMVVTHLKPYPNEFHVLQSNLKSISLYISAKAGMYVIENGAMKTIRK